MLSNPKVGWCELEISNFKGTPSYLTNVPVDLLTAFIDYYKKGIGAVFFDEEGSEFNLLLSNYSAYIIYVDFENKSTLYEFPDIDIDNLAKELITDIKSNIDSWASFYASSNSCMFWSNKLTLVSLVSDLEELVNSRKLIKL